MGLLNDLFSSPQSLAKKSVQDDEHITKAWQEYVETVPKKEELTSKLPFLFGERRTPLLKLSELLTIGLVDIKRGDQDENDLIRNLQSLQHDAKIKRVERLETCLGYVATKYAYAHSLLLHLFVVLTTETALVEKLQNSRELKVYRKLVDALKSEVVVELKLLEKINERPTFHALFLDLVKGEVLIATMDAAERKLYKNMQTVMKGILSGKVNEGNFFQLTSSVFKAIEYKVHNAIGNAPKIDPDGLFAYHSAVDVEFVNRDKFVVLVRQIIKIQRLTDIMSEQVITVFVHFFREWYNHERD